MDEALVFVEKVTGAKHEEKARANNCVCMVDPIFWCMQITSRQMNLMS